MVLKCKDCGSYCINWESTKNRCKCGVIEGFFIDEETISVLSVELDKVLIWKNDSECWQPYDQTFSYPLNLWQGYSGIPFSISHD